MGFEQSGAKIATDGGAVVALSRTPLRLCVLKEGENERGRPTSTSRSTHALAAHAKPNRTGKAWAGAGAGIKLKRDGTGATMPYEPMKINALRILCGGRVHQCGPLGFGVNGFLGALTKKCGVSDRILQVGETDDIATVFLSVFV